MAVVPTTLDEYRRPKPIESLTEEQADEWVRVVDRMPADWFPPETLQVLAQYCRHVVAARRVAQLVQRAESQDELDLDEYERLLKMQEREGRCITSLATKMRLTQQATYTARKGKGKRGTVEAPWE